MHVINTIAPVVLIISVGICLRRVGFISREDYQPVMRLVYWVGLPCLLFYKTAQVTIRAGAAFDIFVVLLGGTVTSVVAAGLGCILLRFRKGARGVFLQGAYRGNLAYVGLPLILFSLAGSNVGGSGELEALAVVAIAPLIPLYNALAVVFLVADGQRQSGGDSVHWGTLLIRVVRNPLILACALGIGYSVTGWVLPVPLGRACATLGNMALPAALLGMGVTLTFSSLHGKLSPALAAALIKVGVAPVAGYLLASVLRLPLGQAQIAVLYLGCPTAVTSYVMAQQLGADDELARNIVVVSTLLAIPVLSVILVLF
ncbi:MAG: AEC family transporter [Candidatus Pacebacteria bacterium]|nr:AEC family transporter [Candidatus Paceibacterota bacterium]